MHLFNILENVSNSREPEYLNLKSKSHITGEDTVNFQEIHG